MNSLTISIFLVLNIIKSDNSHINNAMSNVSSTNEGGLRCIDKIDGFVHVEHESSVDSISDSNIFEPVKGLSREINAVTPEKATDTNVCYEKGGYTNSYGSTDVVAGKRLYNKYSSNESNESYSESFEVLSNNYQLSSFYNRTERTFANCITEYDEEEEKEKGHILGRIWSTILSIFD